MSKIVGVIIPIYNVEKYLKECIESVLKQSYKNLSIVLVNDGSTDENSFKIAKEYAKNDERIVLIDKINGGQSTAKNAGIEFLGGRYELKFKDFKDELGIFQAINSPAIKAIYTNKANIKNQTLQILEIDYLIFLDSDDFWELTCIEECVDRMQGVDVLWFDYKFSSEMLFKKQVLTQMQIFDYSKEGLISSEIWLSRIKNSKKVLPLFWFTWQGMIDFNFLKKIELQFINHIIYEDVHFGILLFSMAKNIYVYPKQLYTYRIRAQSTMNYQANLELGLNSYLCSLLNEFDGNIAFLKRYQNTTTWILTCEDMIKFIEKNPKQCLEMEQIFLSSLLDSSLSLLYQQKDPLELINKFKFFQPYFEKYALSGAECLKQGLEYRLGYLVLKNYRTLKGFFSLPCKMMKEIKIYKQERENFERNIKKFPYIHFIPENLKEQNKDFKRVKNYHSFKLGRVLIKFLYPFGLR